MTLGDDPDLRSPQVVCSVQGHRGGSEPHVDSIRLPAAPKDHLHLRRGRDARAQGQDGQILQGHVPNPQQAY